MGFREKLEKMQNMYLDTERQFVELSYIIPLDNAEITYSPRFYNILQSACGQIENMMRLLCQQLNLSPTCDKFPCLYTALNIQDILKEQRAYVISTYKVIQPFLITSEDSPDWWKNYNKTKHKLPEGLLQGNIVNTLSALSGLYILHHIGHYAETEPAVDILNKDCWYQSYLADVRDPITRKSLRTEVVRISYSEIFSIFTRYKGRGAPL